MTAIIIIGLSGLAIGFASGWLTAALWAAHFGLTKDSNRG